MRPLRCVEAGSVCKLIVMPVSESTNQLRQGRVCDAMHFCDETQIASDYGGMIFRTSLENALSVPAESKAVTAK